MSARQRASGGRREARAASLQARLAGAVRCHRAGRLDAAAQGYEEVLHADPRQPDALHLLGVIAHQRGDQQRALKLIQQALAISRRDPAYHNNLGTVLLTLGRPEEAVAAFRRALALKPGYGEAHSNLGNALMRMGRAEEAADCYRRALAADPGNAAAHNNLGGALREQGRPEEAEESYRRALARRPDYAAAESNLGRVLHEQGRYEEALEHYRRALAIDPGNAEAHANRAITLLLLGRFAEGWAEYEWRWRVRGGTAAKRASAAPPWDGGDPSGRCILVSAEQGLGSAIQFVRYVPLLIAHGARVVLECQKPLRRLFSRLLFEAGAAPAGALRLIDRGEAPPPVDAEVPLMSLPHRFATDAATIPARVPYLGVDPVLAAIWRERLAAAPRPRIGLVWAGNPRHDNDRNRSMPAAALAPLVEAHAGDCLSLQVGAAAAELAALPPGVHDLAPELGDFADTAAVIDALDLVISVDTAVAHLAGALARPVWLLVPFIAEWRWQLAREDSPWYPTMRLFRQPAAGDWPALIERVGLALSGFVDARGGGGGQR